MARQSLVAMAKVINRTNSTGRMAFVSTMIKRFILLIGGIIVLLNGNTIPIMDKWLQVGMVKVVEEIN